MKSKMYKSILAIAIAASLTLAGCSSSSSSSSSDSSSSDTTEEESSDDVQEEASDDEDAESGETTTTYDTDTTYVIGIAEAQSNDEVSTRRDYLENYIAKNYNVKFIFSEQLSDDTDTKTFIENCIDAGADAIIDMKSASGQMAELCAEAGLVYTINGNYTSSPELYSTDYDNFAGCVGANNSQVGSLFREWLEENASEDGSEGFLISTSLASSGNTQHVEITRAILEALQDLYDLTYTETIDDLIASSDTTTVENDKDILITLYPGSPNKDTWLPGISSLLQTGNYQIFMSAGQTYNQSATVVDEVEKGFGMDIKVCSIGALGSTLETAFATEDSSGNSSVNMIAIKTVSTQTAAMFAITYNALLAGTDNDVLRDEDDLPIYFNFNFIAINSSEQLEAMSGWESSDTGLWVADTDFVDQMLVTTNPDVTNESINELMNSLDYDTIVEMVNG